MTGVTELDRRIFNTVSVCRSFRFNGLQEILKRTKLHVKPVILIWQVGDLSARGYFDTYIFNYIVNPEEGRRAVSILKDPSPFELHEKWRDWYQEEFRRYYKVDDLAELIFHEAASFDERKEAEGRLDYLKGKTLRYLWEYYENIAEKQALALEESSESRETTKLKQAFDDLAFRLKGKREYKKAQEVIKYISDLRRFTEDLNRFDETLSDSEYQAFIEFLDSLNA